MRRVRRRNGMVGLRVGRSMVGVCIFAVFVVDDYVVDDDEESEKVVILDPAQKRAKKEQRRKTPNKI